MALAGGAPWSCRPSGGGSNGAAGPNVIPTPGNPSVPAVSRDVNRLSQHIRLPFRPISAVWQIEAQGTTGQGAANSGRTVPGPTDWNLTAVLTFRPQDLQKIVARASRRPAPSSRGIVKPRNWLPAGVRKYVVKDPQTGAYRLQGRVLDAGDFMKLSLANGFMVRVANTSHIYLYLYTM